MALRYLAKRISAPALRRAWGAAPAVLPPAGSRLLSHRSSQGGEYQEYQEYPDLEEMMRESDRLRAEKIRAYRIVQEQLFKEMRLWNEEWDDFEKVVRQDLHDLKRFTNKALKIADLAAIVSTGAFFLAVGAKYLM